MDMYSTLEIITSPSVLIPHCHGSKNEPPYYSGASRETCNIETGCQGGFYSHHSCTTKLTRYCECKKNQDRSIEDRLIKHYFVITNSMPMDGPILCPGCEENCQ